MSRPCTVCAAPRQQRADVESDLQEVASGVRPRSLAAVALANGVSPHALRRHVRSGHSARPLPGVLTLPERDAALNLASVLDRLADASDSARRTRLAAEADGHRGDTLKAIDAEGRVLGTLLLRLGITDLSTVAALGEGRALALAVGDAGRADPGLREAIAQALERRGAVGVAADLRAAS